MPLSAKALRKQLNILKPIVNNLSLKTTRRGQDKMGELTERKYRSSVIIKEHSFDNFGGAWIIPRDERRQGVVLYLHGGGYTCGGLEYATGFGSMLAHLTGTRVFCAAYRLAPENRFPAAVDDALCAYNYLIEKGHSPEHITLCGESAGGGLCYSLCVKLAQKNIPLPCGIIAISPWTDLTLSGESYKTNKDVDPTLTREILSFYAKSYSDDYNDPLVSPLFAKLYNMPPSLIFAGADEILLSDSENMHKQLLAYGSKSRLVVTKDRWHAYILYGLSEDQKDISLINKFLNNTMSPENKLRWLRLDNAAKIYPAARNQNWSNVFRLSATLKDDIDTEVLKTALDVTVRRFPSIAVRLRRGVFWYYLQQLSQAPAISEEASYPLTRMSKQQTRKCAFRVIVYKKRIAVEFFHSITDGNGGLVFLKSLVAEYIQQKYNVKITAECGVLPRLEEPTESELEDSFQKYSGPVAASRRENDAWHLSGTPTVAGFLNLTCFEIDVKSVLEKAHEYGVSLTVFITAAVMMALQNMQKEAVPNVLSRKPIKILIPVNLRKVFESSTLRNFALYVTPGIMPKLGEYSFKEICDAVYHHLASENTPKIMSTKIATNVNSERHLAVRIMPLFIKNLVMKAVFNSVGERKSCLTLSNLGAVKLPEDMVPFVERMDFILGVQATAPHNCGVISYGDKLYINFIRNIKESDLEYHFFRVLRDMGIGATVQSNRGEKNVLC